MVQSLQLSYGQVVKKKIAPLSKELLIGVWQFSSSKVGAGLLENFKFFKDGAFIYSFDPVSENKKLVNIKGMFRVHKNELYLKISSLTEAVGGNVVSGAVGTDLDVFVIDKAVVKERKVSPSNELDALFITVLDEKGRSLMINNKKFFKLTSDPNKTF